MAPPKEKKARSTINEVVTREYTIHLHKRIKGMWVDFEFLEISKMFAFLTAFPS